MTTQMQNQSIGEFARWGFTLKHPDDHFVELYHQGELVARFSQAGVTRASLKTECARHLDENHLSNILKGGIPHAS